MFNIVGHTERDEMFFRVQADIHHEECVDIFFNDHHVALTLTEAHKLIEAVQHVIAVVAAAKIAGETQ